MTDFCDCCGELRPLRRTPEGNAVCAECYADITGAKVSAECGGSPIDETPHEEWCAEKQSFSSGGEP